MKKRNINYNINYYINNINNINKKNTSIYKKMEKSDDIEISIIKGDRLFNQNTPFAINLTTHEPDENDKKSNADLICVIDVSGSMYGTKIEQVKESLKILINLMDEKDRICLILFNSTAENYYKLNY